MTKRSKNFTLLAGSILSVFCYANTMAQDTAKGFVYVDQNENGKKDKREIGISGVAVSNGIEVVKTKKDGSYELPVDDDTIIFVIKPAQYGIPVNENMLPQFYYIHKPNGSPKDMTYPGVLPTGPLPKSVDFGLIPQKEEEKFRVLVFGDPQVYSQQDIDWFRKGILEELQGVKNVAFGISLGDLVGDNLHLFNNYIDEMKTLGIPWYNMVGNHDLNFDTSSDELTDESYEAKFGPANYSFEYGKAHFIVLDDILVPDPRKDSGYWGGLRPDQLQFLKNDIEQTATDKLIVISYHIPMGKWGFREEDRKELFTYLKNHPKVLMMAGHTHLQRHNFYGKEDGWLQEHPVHEYNAGTTSGDWYSGELNSDNVPFATMRDGTEKGYAFLTVEGNAYSIDYKVAGKENDYQIGVFAPKVVGYRKDTTFDVFANFFMGDENSKVEYHIGDGEWKTMEKIDSFDPSYYEAYRRWDTMEALVPGRRPSNPVTSSHLWKGAVTTELPIGTATLQIRATDLFGQVHTATKEIRIDPPKDLPKVK